MSMSKPARSFGTVVTAAAAAVIPAWASLAGVAPIARAAAATLPAPSAVAHPGPGFELNAGQTDPKVRFLTQSRGGTLFLTGNEAVLALTPQPSSPRSGHRLAGSAAAAASGSPTVLRMRTVGGAPSPQVVGLDRMPSVRNYMIGNDPSKWHLGVPSFARVAYRDVYPGVDLVYHDESGEVEYDFVVAPGADPSAIQLDLSGQRSLSLDAAGDLVLDTAVGTVVQQRPALYQEAGSVRQSVKGGYRLTATGHVTFDIGAHDASRPLVIDPVIVHSTYLGGSGSTGNDEGNSIVVDSSGNAYVAGDTQSADFPVTTQLGPRNTSTNAYVLKLNATGSTVTWSTVFGGSNTQGDVAEAVAVDPASGNVWVTGFTHSTDFPTTPTAFKAARTCQQATCPSANAFVTEFNNLGAAMLYSTYLGGAGGANGSDFRNETGDAIAVDSTGKAVVGGETSSPDFPTTTGAFQTTYAGVCCTASDNHGFISKFDGGATGAASLVFSTFLEGTTSEGVNPNALRLDASNNAWVGGATSSRDFPVTTGAYQTSNRTTQANSYDGFVSKLNAAGTALLYSTYLGGSGTGISGEGDSVNGIALGPSGTVYASGGTCSTDFPTTTGAYSRSYHGGNAVCGDAFLTVLNPAGTGSADLKYSTYFGGSGDDSADAPPAVDSAGNAYIAGSTRSIDLSIANPLQGVFEGRAVPSGDNVDLFVAKINPAGGGASDLLLSTFFGGTGMDLAHGMAMPTPGVLYLTGLTRIPATPGGGALPVPFPTTRGVVRETWTPSIPAETGFVTKLDLSGTTAIAGVSAGNNGVWSKADAQGYTALGGVLTAAPAVVAVPVSGGMPTPLYIGVGSDKNVYVRSATQGWQALSSTPVACLDTVGATVTTSSGTSTLTVACQGTDHALYDAQGTVTSGSLPSLSSWSSLGGVLGAGPAVATVGGNLTFLVAGSNGAIYTRTTSSGWTAAGWTCKNHPALANYRGNAYFACHGSDDALWYAINTGSGWGAAQSAGGTMVDGPGIVATPAEVLIYVQGNNGALYHATLSPGGGPIAGWTADGGSIQFGTGATTLTP